MVWALRDGKWRQVSTKPNDQTIRILQSAMIRAIYDNDAALTPAEQQHAIMALPGISAAEMEATIPLSGTPLAQAIRNIISKHRGTNRTDKDQNRV